VRNLCGDGHLQNIVNGLATNQRSGAFAAARNTGTGNYTFCSPIPAQSGATAAANPPLPPRSTVTGSAISDSMTYISNQVEEFPGDVRLTKTSTTEDVAYGGFYYSYFQVAPSRP